MEGCPVIGNYYFEWKSFFLLYVILWKPFLLVGEFLLVEDIPCIEILLVEAVRESFFLLEIMLFIGSHAFNGSRS